MFRVPASRFASATLSIGMLAIAARTDGFSHLALFVALVPWLVALDAASGWRRLLVESWLFTMAFVIVVFGWFAIAMQRYAEISPTAAWLLLAALAPVLQPQWIVHAFARRMTRRAKMRCTIRVIASAVAYVGAEWVFPKLFRDTLGHGFFMARTLRQAADIAGVPGLTFALVIVNECLGLVWREVRTAGHDGRMRWRRLAVPAFAAGAVIAMLQIYGMARLRVVEAATAQGAPVVAGIVQAGLSQYGRMARELGTFEGMRRILDAHFASSEELRAREPIDLLIWPETVYPTTFGAPKSSDGDAFDHELGAFVAHAGVPLVFGAYDAEDGREFNAAFLLEPGERGAQTFDAYRKANLFPLTERVPAWLDRPSIRARFPWLGSWVPGTPPQPMRLTLPAGRTVLIAPLVCYDAVMPRLARDAVRAGADLLVTLSNDAWFVNTPGARLHLAVSAFRSVETRRAQLRAANTGISAGIDATGELIESLPDGTRGVIVAHVTPGGVGPTLAMRLGGWPEAGCAVATAITIVFASGRIARTRVAAGRAVRPRPRRSSLSENRP